MHVNRAGENGLIPARGGRFFEQSPSWYFHTREGASIGPFENRTEAEQGLQDFLDFITLAAPTTLASFYASLSKAASLSQDLANA